MAKATQPGAPIAGVRSTGRLRSRLASYQIRVSGPAARTAEAVLTVRAVVFDIGGVLEITPPLGIVERWESAFGLRPGELDERAQEVWAGGEVGTLTEAEVHRHLAELLDADPARITAFMEEVWVEYLGTPNVGLIDYLRGLRPRHRTGIISNSFVGAREREQERYGFGELTDALIYSHEVGLSKPDPASTCWPATASE
jgi:putative hydrolase of the HAD superfamily